MVVWYPTPGNFDIYILGYYSYVSYPIAIR